MRCRAIVAGTGFEGRAARIRMCAKPGMPVYLVREPRNKYDPNAISVHLRLKRWYTLFITTDVQIGYIKKSRAASLSQRIDQGGKVLSARIHSMYTDRDHPRVSIDIETDW